MEGDDEFYLHITAQYDYHYESSRREEIIRLLQSCAKTFANHNVPAVQLSKAHISSLVKSKKDVTGLIFGAARATFFTFSHGQGTPTSPAAADEPRVKSMKNASNVLKNAAEILKPDSSSFSVNVSANAIFRACEDLLEVINAFGGSFYGENTEVRILITKSPQSTPSDIVRLVCELLINSMTCEKFKTMMVANNNKKNWAKLLLNSILLLMNHEDSKTRYWSLKVILNH